MDDSLKFIEAMNKSGKPVWIKTSSCTWYDG